MLRKAAVPKRICDRRRAQNADFYFELIKYLNKGGYLWVNGFSSLPINNSDVTQKDLIIQKDFEYIQNILLDKKEYEDGDRKFVRYCFRKQLS